MIDYPAEHMDLLESAPVPIRFVSANGTILWANDAELNLLGYDRDEYIGSDLREFDADGGPVADLIARVGRGDEMDEYPARLRCADGAVRDVLISTNGVWREGTFVHSRCFTRDVTERKRADRLREEQQALLEKVSAGISLRESLDAICASVSRLVPGARAAIVEWNAEFPQFRCHSAPELLPFCSQFEALGPAQDPAYRELTQAVCSKQPISYPDLDPSWRGPAREIWARFDIHACHFEPVPSDDDRLEYLIVGFEQPCSPGTWELRVAQMGAQIATIALQLEESSRALKDSQRELERKLSDAQRLQEVSTHLIQEDDLEALYGQVLEAASAIMESDCASIQRLDHETQDLHLLAHRGFTQEAAERWSCVRPSTGTTCGRVLRSGEREFVANIESEMPEDCEQRAIYLRAGIHAVQSTPLRSRDGRLLGMISTHWFESKEPSQHGLDLLDVLARQAADLIDRTRSERALRDSENRLWELNQSLERRIGERTTELRQQTERLQQLAAELTGAEYKERKRLAAMLHDDLQQVLVAAQLRLTRSRADSEESAESVVEAERLMEEALTKARDLTRELRPPVLYEDGLVSALRGLVADFEGSHGVATTVEADECIPTLSDDLKALLFDCSRELLLNVAKHAGANSARVEVRHGDGLLRVCVRDTGRGFEVARLEHTDHRQKSFGVFSIRERVSALGGSVGIESELGKGTCVTLNVAISEGEDGHDPASVTARATGQAQAPRDARGTTRILLVDDHKIVRQGIAGVLNENRWCEVVAEAGDGAEAIAQVEEYQPDVVLMDIQMPRVNGLEATRDISRRWPSVIVVGLSVQHDEPTARSMREAGALGFLPKSGDADEMISTILGLIESKRSTPA